MIVNFQYKCESCDSLYVDSSTEVDYKWQAAALLKGDKFAKQYDDVIPDRKTIHTCGSDIVDSLFVDTIGIANLVGAYYKQ